MLVAAVSSVCWLSTRNGRFATVVSFADASTLSTSDWARFSVDADLPCTISWLNDCE